MRRATATGFLGVATELEYGVKAWWTTEFYLEGQSTKNDSTVLTGFRWENRFRVLPREHWINPVLYVEFKTSTELTGVCSKWSTTTGRTI